MASFSFTVLVPSVAGAASAAEVVTEPIDFLLDELTGDLVLDSDLHWSHGIGAVAQGLGIRLRMFRGEWFLDLDFGIPYFQDLLGQKFDELKIREAFRKMILASPGVDELLSLGVEFLGATRTLNVSWEVRTEFGLTTDELAMGV